MVSINVYSYEESILEGFGLVGSLGSVSGNMILSDI